MSDEVVDRRRATRKAISCADAQSRTYPHIIVGMYKGHGKDVPSGLGSDYVLGRPYAVTFTLKMKD